MRRDSEALRRQGYHEVVQRLHDRFGLRRDLDVDRATDLLLACGGTAIWRSLVVDYGWADDEFVDWLADTLRRQLLPA